MPTFHLKADIQFEAQNIDAAKAELSDIFRDFKRGKKVVDYEGQIALEPIGFTIQIVKRETNHPPYGTV